MDNKDKFIDYSHEANITESHFLRMVYFSLSCFFMILGIIGVFLPVVPTTPFVLVSAYLYARSSKRFYNWLMNHKLMGPPLRRWKETGTIAKSTKVYAICVLTVSMGITIFFIIPIDAVKIGMGVVWAGVTLYLLRIPSS